MIDKADIAIVISALSAIFTGLSVRYARRLAKNDTARMKRKRLVIEADIPEQQAEKFSSCKITIRNLEPIAADLIAIELKTGNGALVEQKARGADKYGNIVAQGESSLREHLTKRIELGLRVGPYAPSQPKREARSELHLRLVVFGIVRKQDLTIKWAWADGERP